MDKAGRQRQARIAMIRGGLNRLLTRVGNRTPKLGAPLLAKLADVSRGPFSVTSNFHFSN